MTKLRLLFCVFGARRLDSVDLAQVIQAHERKHLLAETQNLAAIDAVNLFVGGAGDFDDRRKRHGKQAATDANNKVWMLASVSGARSCIVVPRVLAGGDVDSALEAIHYGADNIHTHATA